MIRLVEPSPQLRDSWWESRLEFGAAQAHGYSLFGWEDAELETDSGFERWLDQQRRGVTEPPPDLVPASLYWIVEEAEPDRVLGSLHLRHELTDSLFTRGGHIGYGVRPDARGRGVAGAALMASLERARELGLDRVLLTCEDDNIASARTILRCGGVLEDVRDGMRRHWIDL